MALYLLNLLDLVSTLLALSWGAVEMNPIVAFLMGIHPALFPLVKIVPAYFLCRWLARNAKESSAARGRYIGIVIIYAAVVANNLRHIVNFILIGVCLI